jgi:Rieske Fe-S protein
MFKQYIVILFALIMIGATGCNTNDSNIPNVAVDFRIPISNPSYISLNAVGGYVYLLGGSKGIIVVRSSIDQFRAFDRHCPYNPIEGCKVTVNDTDIEAECDVCCNSKFLALDGSVIQGPSPLPLKEYQTNFDGNILYIFN